MNSNPVCIRRTGTVEEAEILVAWLDAKGVKATIADPDSTGVFAFGVTDTEGVEIYVADEETAKRAKTLLAEHDKERDAAASQEASSETVDVKCGECGQINAFRPEQRGTVQECEECNAFIDVPSA